MTLIPGGGPNGSNGLPQWFRLAVLSIFVGVFVVHLAVDIARPDYDGGSLSLLLAGIVGAALGINQVINR